MESNTHKPYSAPSIEEVEVVLESKVLQIITVSGPKISDLDEDNDEFIW